MALLIDTDLLIDLERGAGTPAVEEILGDEDRAISVITVSELLHGARRGNVAQRAHRGAFVEHLLGAVRAIPITEPVARVHAEAWVDLSNRGQLIGAHVLWIAATAIAHGLGVATHNAAEFGRVSGLRVVPTAG